MLDYMIPMVVVVVLVVVHLLDSHTYHSVVSADWKNHTDHEVWLLECLLLLTVMCAM